MTLKNAKHFMAFAMAAYGWPLVCYMHCCTAPFRLARLGTCCACFRYAHRLDYHRFGSGLTGLQMHTRTHRSKARTVVDDNCCLCHVAGVKFMSRLSDDDVLHASFKNQVFEVRPPV